MLKIMDVAGDEDEVVEESRRSDDHVGLRALDTTRPKLTAKIPGSPCDLRRYRKDLTASVEEPVKPSDLLPRIFVGESVADLLERNRA